MPSYISEQTTQTDYEKITRCFSKTENHHKHLPKYLIEAGDFERAYCLLFGNRAWMDAKYELFNSDQSYLNDIDMALGYFSEDLDSKQILAFTQLHMARLCALGLADRIPDLALETLVLLGREGEALDNGTLWEDPQVSINRLLVIDQALKRCQRPDPKLIDKLLDFAGLLDPPSAPGVLHEIALKLRSEKDPRAIEVYKAAIIIGQNLKDNESYDEWPISFTERMSEKIAELSEELANLIFSRFVDLTDLNLDYKRSDIKSPSENDLNKWFKNAHYSSPQQDPDLGERLVNVAYALALSKDARANSVLDAGLRVLRRSGSISNSKYAYDKNPVEALQRRIQKYSREPQATDDIRVSQISNNTEARTVEEMIEAPIEAGGLREGITKEEVIEEAIEAGDFEQALNLAITIDVRCYMETIDRIAKLKAEARQSNPLLINSEAMYEEELTEEDIDAENFGEAMYEEELIEEAIEAGDFGEALLEAQRIDDGYRRVEAIVKISKLMVANGYLDWALETARTAVDIMGLERDWAVKEVLYVISEYWIKLGEWETAVSVLSARNPEPFLYALTKWCDFINLEQAVDILRETTRIAGWLFNELQEIHTSFCAIKN